MKKNWMLRITAMILLAGAPALVFAADDGEKPRAGLGIWDAAEVNENSLNTKEGWTQIPVGETPAAFKSDGVLSNGKLSLVLRQRGGVELYSHSANGWALSATLAPTLIAPDTTAAGSFSRAVVTDNGKGAVSVEVLIKEPAGAVGSVKFKLKKGDGILECEPSGLAAALRVQAPSRFVVLPDLFADDIVINPRKIAPDVTDIPSENFLLQMTGKGDAIVMSVFENRQQDAKLILSGKDDERIVASAEIPFGTTKNSDGVTKPNKIWLAPLNAPNIWHTSSVKKADAGKTIALDWKMPMAATWRVDFTRPNELTDSWTMLLQEKEGGQYTKPSWLGSGDGTLDMNRKRWNTVLGTFAYPAWSDSERKGFLQPLKSDKLSFDGPILIYPIARQKQTPVDALTVMDVIRNSLGAGPCEYILDLEGQKGSYRGRATCNTRDTLGAIYKKNEQKAKRAEVDKILDEAMAFCTHIRGRITRYQEFAEKMHAYLTEQKKARPELSGFIDEMEQFTQEIDKRYDARKEKIRTLAYVAQLNADFRKNVLDDTAPEALEKCKKYSHDLVEVGDNQDELSSEMRWAVKSLRQKAGLALAADSKAAPVANEIRARTQAALKNPANHEGAQH